jgi:hypothetical protein
MTLAAMTARSLSMRLRACALPGGFFVLESTLVLAAQSTQKPLTNSDAMRVVEAGLLQEVGFREDQGSKTAFAAGKKHGGCRG